MPQNIIDKIWTQHVVLQNLNQPAILGIDLQLTHEVTSPQGFAMLEQKALPVKYPGKHVATLDHSIPTRKDREVINDPIAKKQIELLRKNTKNFNIPLYDFESGHQGIVHVIGPELGLTQPGMTIVCGDSHTATHGAFGALAFGIGSTEVGFVLASGCLLQRKPKTMKVEFKGKIPEGVYSKDLILYLISQIGVGGANGYVIEYTGEAIRTLSMEARMSICNMSIECGARAGLVSPDEKTFEYIKGKDFAPKDEDWSRAVEYWSSFVSDKEAFYDKEISIDSWKLKPMITWGTNPAQGMFIDSNVPTEEEIPEEQKKNYHQALDYTKLKPGQKLLGEKIDWVFIGSCTNGRIEDLRIAASEFYSKDIPKQIQHISPNITMYIVPGSEEVKRQAEEEGLDKIFLAAGADWRMPGCSMCLGMNDDKVPSAARCVSTSNRNFMHRQGPGAITHLVSPAIAVKCAIAGEISF